MLSPIANCLLIFVCMCLGGERLLGQGRITIGFDDLPANDWGGDPIPNSYLGLQWSNFYVYDQFHAANPNYLAGIVSPSNAVFNAGGYLATLSSGSRFDLISAYLTAAWDNGLLFEVRGFAGADQLYDNTYPVHTAAPQFIEFDFLGVDRVEFRSYGEYQANQFVMDDLTIAIPEPCSIGLALGVCLCSFTFCRKLRR